MRLLLDTHTFIYFVDHPEAIPPAARAELEDPANDVLLSVVSPWEMQIKVSLGKLRLEKTVVEMVQAELGRNALRLLPVALEHIAALSQLPSHHRDPFDRLLVAQAMHEGLTLVSSDEAVAQYGPPILWK